MTNTIQKSKLSIGTLLILVTQTLAPAPPVFMAGLLTFFSYNDLVIVIKMAAYVGVYMASLFFCFRLLRENKIKRAIINTIVINLLAWGLFLPLFINYMLD